jgi:hypothetical protein
MGESAEEPGGGAETGDTGTKTLDDQLALETAKYNLSKYLANEQLTLIQSQYDIISKLLPATGAKQPEGKVAVEGEKLGFVNEQIAYYGLKKIALDIHTLIDPKLLASDRILITDKLGTAPDDVVYIGVRTQFELYRTLLDNQSGVNDTLIKKVQGGPDMKLMELPLLALALAPSLIGSVANIAGYFRSDYAIKGMTLEVKNEGLIATVAGALARDNRGVYIFNNYLLEPASSALMTMLKECQEKSIRLNAQKTVLAALAKKLPELADDMTAASSSTDALLSSLDTFLKEVMAPSGEAPSRLSQAVLRERIRALEITHILYLSVISSGGETITRSRIVGNSLLYYLSGAVVSCILTDTRGKVVVSEFFPVLYSWKFSFDAQGNQEPPYLISMGK